MNNASRCLVTGEKGFIATNLFRHFGENYIPANCDVLNIEQIKSRIREVAPDCVLHLAAISTLKQCEQERDVAWNVNVLGTENVVKAIAEVSPATKLLFFSTAQVYDLNKSGENAIDESYVINPLNYYATTKWEAEKKILEISSRTPVSGLILRLFNHVHCTQGYGVLFEVFRQVLENKEKGARRPIRVGNLDLYRDIGAISDLLSAIESLTSYSRSVNGFSIFNVCNGTKRHLRDLAYLLVEQIGAEANFETDPSLLRVSDPKVILGANSKLKVATSWQPKIISDRELISSFLAAE